MTDKLPKQIMSVKLHFYFFSESLSTQFFEMSVENLLTCHQHVKTCLSCWCLNQHDTNYHFWQRICQYFYFLSVIYQTDVCQELHACCILVEGGIAHYCFVNKGGKIFLIDFTAVTVGKDLGFGMQFLVCFLCVVCCRPHTPVSLTNFFLQPWGSCDQSVSTWRWG